MTGRHALAALCGWAVGLGVAFLLAHALLEGDAIGTLIGLVLGWGVSLAGAAAGFVIYDRRYR